MTQDELRAALLLMGLEYSRKNLQVMYGRKFSVTFNITNENVRITYYRSGLPRSCSYNPQAAFDFIKKRFL